jgi:hypothetical protein
MAFSPVSLAAPRLRVSDNKHFLVKEDGTPFFYLGDTAWELFHRLNREDADRYLQDRSAKRFTVIQAVVLAEFDGLQEPNAYGHVPLHDNNPAQPNEDYFKHVDYVVNRAESLGLFVGMLPTWGDKVGPKLKWGVGPEIFSQTSAAAYGEFLGRRYKDKPIIWILGGDRAPDNPDRFAIWRAMAQGLRKGDGGSHLITYHPSGGHSSAEWFHEEPWLDFNMQQNGHSTDTMCWERITREYNRKPTKPVIDGEPLYEDHPIAFNARERGYSNAADVRKFAYWDLFAGACGHTYGNHSVWQMYTPQRKPINGPLNFWTDAIQKPGARQMQYVRALIESRPILSRVPDQSVLASDPMSGAKRIQATRGADGSYAFVYIPASRTFTVRMDRIKGPVKAWWYNPRIGQATAIGEFPNTGTRDFAPADEGENVDWVLVLDDAGSRFPPPGAVK